MSRIQKNSNNKSNTPSNKVQPLTWKDKLLPQDYEHLKSVFDLFDEDHSGLIDPEEINKIMGELGDERKETFTFGLIEGLKDKSKPINFDEFLELVCPKVGDVKTKQGIATIFSHIDKKEDGGLDF